MNNSIYPVIKDTVRIKKTSNFCWIEELLNDSGTIASPLEAFLLSLCTGEHDIDTIEYILSETIGINRNAAKEEVSKALERLAVCIHYQDAPAKIHQRYLPESFLYYPEKIKDNPRGRFETPAEAVLVLTKSCNFRCIYCYNSSGKRKSTELNTQQWMDAVRQMKALDVVKCTLTGGEPLMNPGFFEILTELVKNDILPYICTNGSLLDEKAILKLKELKIPVVQISLDSSSSKEHDALTCSHDTFDKITHAIGRLVRLGIKVYVKSVVLPQNLHSVPDLIDLCYRLGVSNLVLDRYDLSFIGRGDNSFFLDRKSEKELIQLVDSRRESAKGMNINLIAGERNWKCGDDTVMCGAFIQSFVIMPDGSYAVCEKLDDVPEMGVGNFKDLTIKEMWNSKRIDEITQPPKERFPEPCRSCEHLESCGSGCYAAKLFVTDDLYGPDPKCWRANYKDNQFLTE